MPRKYRQWPFCKIKRTHKTHMGPNWVLKVNRKRDTWKGDQREANRLRLQPWKPLQCNSTPGLHGAASQWLVFWLPGLLPTGMAPFLDVTHCLASGTEVRLLSKGMTYPSRCHYSYSGINRHISVIGQALYGAFLVPCSLSDGYKLV